MVRISVCWTWIKPLFSLSLFLCQEPYGIIEVVKIRSSKQVSVLSANIKPADCGTYSSAAVLILHNSSTWLRSSSRSHSRFLLESKRPTINKNSQTIDMDRNLTWNYTLKVHQQYNDVIFNTVLPPTRNNITVSHLLTSRAIFSSVNIATFVSSFDLVPKNKQRKSVSSPTHPRVWRVTSVVDFGICISYQMGYRNMTISALTSTLVNSPKSCSWSSLQFVFWKETKKRISGGRGKNLQLASIASFEKKNKYMVMLCHEICRILKVQYVTILNTLDRKIKQTFHSIFHGLQQWK